MTTGVRAKTQLVNIPDCGRCGRAHYGLVFTRFNGAPITRGGRTYDWWGVCPTTGDPILARTDALPLVDTELKPITRGM